MPVELEEVTQQAIQLPRHQRLVLARLLLELEDGGEQMGIDAAWDDEIQARIKAYDEGRVEVIAYEDVAERMRKRFAA